MDNSWRGIEVINNRWNPKGTRLYKHGIFSFGKPNLDPKKAMQVTDEILAFYSDRYPIIYSIHTNIPRRIHSHFIMGMVDIRTGKKFNQSIQELNAFKKHFNEVVTSYGLPALKNYVNISLPKNFVEGKNTEAINCDEPLNKLDIVSNCENRFYPEQTIILPTCNYNQMGKAEQAINGNLDLITLTNECNKNMYEWYLRGKGVM